MTHFTEEIDERDGRISEKKKVKLLGKHGLEKNEEGAGARLKRN